MICKILSCGVCDIKCLFLIYLLSIIFLMLHYLVFKVQSLNMSYSYPPLLTHRRGGDEENRTPDPLLARQVLSQLSYTPILVSLSYLKEFGGPKWTRTTDLTLIRRAL